MALTIDMEQYAASVEEEAKQFLKSLAVIPAPSHHEEKRVAFVKDWMEKNGAQGVYVDEALNVIWPIKDDGKCDVVVFMAHTDVVFPDMTPLPLKEENGRLYCPGVGDDTTRLTLLLHAVRYYTRKGLAPNTGLVVVANSCEEGLGNLKGSRAIVDHYGSRLKTLITVDGSPAAIVTRAVGSHRYEVTVRTEGGHSYGDFGCNNAIACLASLITTLYSVKVPERPGTKTTYNVGGISGGTSVNTIAQEASMLYEYRSDDKECLDFMQNMFEKTVEAYRAMGLDISVKVLGKRPCSGDVKEPEYSELKAYIGDTIREVIGVEPKEKSGSTDANYPLSLGIPAVCIGAGRGSGAHTREEYVELDSLREGLRFLLAVLSKYFA